MGSECIWNSFQDVLPEKNIYIYTYWFKKNYIGMANEHSIRFF